MAHRLRALLKEAGIDLTGDEPPDSAAWQRFRKMMADDQLAEHLPDSLISILADTVVLTDNEGTVTQILSSGKSNNIADALRVGKTLDATFACDFETARNLVESALRIGSDVSDTIELNGNTYELKAQADENSSQHVLVLIHDITATIESNKRLRLNTTMFNATDQGFAVLDSSYNVVSINKALTRILGLHEEDIIDRPPYFLDSIRNRQQSETIWAALSSGRSWRGEFSARNSNNQQVPLWLSVDTVLDDNGNITNHLILLIDISDEKESLNKLQFIATHDSLTGLPNRISFFEQLEKAVNRSQASQRSGALLSFDIDRFKNINESLGHQLGDELLVIISERLLAATRDQDFLARLGGDEFILVAEGVQNRTIATIIAEKILAVFETPIPLGNYNIEVTASIGITMFPRDGVDSGLLLRQADTAMYMAKEQGNNSYHFFSEELAARKSEFFELEMSLRKAQNAGELYLVYQPQYNLESGQIVGAEALTRWNHPLLGPISPGQFIPIAEVSGFIDNLGDWIIETALNEYSNWGDAVKAPFLLSINLSRRQLVNPRLVYRLEELFETHKVDPHHIEFEITEHAIVNINDTAVANVEAIRALGCQIAMDDFGTGDSSLLNLKRFVFNRLKIDQSFVADVTKDANDEAIIRAVIALGNSLNITVIAEGVETEEQAEFLRNEGCDQVQGYLYSKPLEAEACLKLLQEA